jgi:DNA/RNA endonuclease YhcR with UshA esterase domain
VIATHNTGRVVFLNFSSEYQHTFRAVIFPEDWGKFTHPPEDLFYGQQVRITGAIEEYKGAPEIIIRQPAQIQIIAPTACPACPPCPTREPQPVTPESIPASTAVAQTVVPPTTVTQVPIPVVIVPFEQAGDHMGEKVTVEGTVVDTYRSEKVVRLNFHEDWRHHFNVAMFPEVWPLFPVPPEDMFRGQLVRVRGSVEEYQGAPEIIVRSPEQIVIVGGE